MVWREEKGTTFNNLSVQVRIGILMPTPRQTFRFDEKMWSRFVKKCDSHGYYASEVLRAFIVSVIKGETSIESFKPNKKARGVVLSTEDQILMQWFKDKEQAEADVADLLETLRRPKAGPSDEVFDEQHHPSLNDPAPLQPTDHPISGVYFCCKNCGQCWTHNEVQCPFCGAKEIEKHGEGSNKAPKVPSVRE
jgi:rubrerythrin